MSARLTPGTYNEQTLARIHSGEASTIAAHGWGSIGHDRYGRSIGHRAESGMTDPSDHVRHAAPDLRPRARQATVKFSDVARFTA